MDLFFDKRNLLFLRHSAIKNTVHGCIDIMVYNTYKVQPDKIRYLFARFMSTHKMPDMEMWRIITCCKEMVRQLIISGRNRWVSPMFTARELLHNWENLLTIHWMWVPIKYVSVCVWRLAVPIVYVLLLLTQFVSPCNHCLWGNRRCWQLRPDGNKYSF